jgi:nicotinamide-nucleotide adenylyltransferase
MTHGVLWGRFNPPHKGHLWLVKHCRSKVDKLTLVIGSAQESGTRRNPFSAAERIRMWRAYLREAKVTGVRIFSQADHQSDAQAVRNLWKLTRGFDVIFTDKSLIRRIIGKRARVEGYPRVGGWSSTKLRRAIVRGERWERMTGRSVARIIKSLSGEVRIRASGTKKLEGTS